MNLRIPGALASLAVSVGLLASAVAPTVAEAATYRQCRVVHHHGHPHRECRLVHTRHHHRGH